MKIFVIGGATVHQKAPEYRSQLDVLGAAMERIGKDIVARGHDLVVCSPFEGSADRGALRGAIRFLETSRRVGPAIELHYPAAETVLSEVALLTGTPPCPYFRMFHHPISKHADGSVHWVYTWLLSQLAALENSQAVIALGGKTSGPANLLLTLAASQSKHVLPLAFLGGAAARSLQSLRWPLDDLLDHRAALLDDPACVEDAMGLVEELANRGSRNARPGTPLKLFISYPRSRPEEADFIEMILRRRQLDVYRDERSFGAGSDLPHEILAHIDRSNVFVVIWCKEYACSPWCHDEFAHALQLRGEGRVELWILCVDDTRIVPPGARNLINYPARTREEIERHVLTLLERWQANPRT